MTRYLKATDKRGLTVPWVYARRALARAWGCRPWEVDEAPIDEVLLELELTRIEGAAEVADLTVAVELVGKDNLSGAFGAAQKGVSGFTDGLGKLGLAGLGVQTAIGTITSGVQALIGPAMDAQKNAAQLDAVLKSTGGAAGVTAASVGALSTSLSKVTMFEDDAITSAQSLLLTFTNIGQDVFPAATETVLNMSQALGQDLSSSSMQLGKALNDPIKGIGALSRVGVTFTDEQKDLVKQMVAVGDTAGAQGIILGELEKEFGGAAKAAGETLAGSLTIAQNQLGEVQETIGGALIPVLAKFMSALVPLIEAFAENLPAALETVQPMLDFLAENAQNLVIPAIVALGAVTVAAGAAMVIALGPVVLAVGAVGIAIAGLTLLWTSNWGDIQGKVETVWGVIAPIFALLGAALDLFTTTILPALLLGWTTTWDDINTKFATVWGLIQTTINTIWPAVEKVILVGTALVKGDWLGAWTAVQAAFTDAWTEIQKAVDGMVATVLDTLHRLAGDALTAAKAVGEGIVNGVKNAIVDLGGGIKDALMGMVNAALDAAKNALSSWKPSLPSISVPKIGAGGGGELVGGDVPPGIASGISRGMATLGSQAWNGLCEQWIGDMFGSRRYPTAWADALANTTNPRGMSPPPGQLVFFKPDASNQGAGHVGVSLGGNKFLSATASGVRIDDLTSAYWNSLYHGFGPPRYADGVRGHGGGLAVVGERGWEVANLPRGTDVYSHSESRRLLAGAAGGGVNIHFHGPVYGFDEFEDRVVQANERAARRGRG